jgi:hypothetical protein
MKKLISKLFNMIRNKITINGVTTEVTGSNIVVRNGVVLINEEVIVRNLSGDVHIKFEGDLASLDATNVSVNGNIMGNVDGVNVTVNGNITGNVDGTLISAKEINGKVDALNVKMLK